MQRKKLKDMNLLDDFLFFSMMNYPEIGDRFSRILLEIIFNRRFGALEIIPQKVYYGEDSDKHGIRLDVYLEEDDCNQVPCGQASIYDIEPDLKDDLKNIQSLPRRVRFYHSKIDAHELKSGKDYNELKKVVVIMIMPYDPFGYNHMVYTIRNHCVELPDMPYDDGAKTIFLYTKGTQGDISSDLQGLLGYMADTKVENATTDALRELQSMVDVVKGDTEVSRKAMRIDEHVKDAREEGKIEAKTEAARKLFANGASYELVRASIDLLSDEELQGIYHEVCGQ